MSTRAPLPPLPLGPSLPFELPLLLIWRRVRAAARAAARAVAAAGTSAAAAAVHQRTPGYAATPEPVVLRPPTSSTPGNYPAATPPVRHAAIPTTTPTPATVTAHEVGEVKGSNVAKTKAKTADKTSLNAKVATGSEKGTDPSKASSLTSGSKNSADGERDDQKDGAKKCSGKGSKAGTGGGRWTKEEDLKLRAAVAAIGPKNWKRISEEFLGGIRSDVQCLHRWQSTTSEDTRYPRRLLHDNRPG